MRIEKTLSTPVRFIKGVGPAKAKKFHSLGIATVEDALYYFPRRYQDRTHFVKISEIKEGGVYTVKAHIYSAAKRSSFRRSRFQIIELLAGDETGTISCAWFNQPYLIHYFQSGRELILYGKVERYGNRLQMHSPEFELVDEQEEDCSGAGGFVPVYALAQGMTQRYFRRFIKNMLNEYLPSVNDFLPYDIRARGNFLNLARSLRQIHFPDDSALRQQAYERLSFEEFFLFQIPLIIRKVKRRQEKGIVHSTSGKLAGDFISSLPFTLTAAQEKVIEEIRKDLVAPWAMQRLLQGEVGSGKTVVATIAALMAVQGGYQVAFMAPTEVLARQHYENIGSRVTGIGSRGRKVRIKLLVSSLKKQEKQEIYKHLKNGDIDIVIGTHALLQESVDFKKLGLAVIDEQHKFGVGQRSILTQKGINPDYLIMTATPIPRTLAITLYGDLDISVINELPPGRKEVKTFHFPHEKKNEVYEFIKDKIKNGNQAYVVYPVIEESYALDISGAKKMYEEFKREEFKDFRVGLIHGKMKQKEQDQAMRGFKSGVIDILVSTTVLEVGIDVANATCMVVQNAERFGLSQLHQLRGRIGRGSQESFCFLVSDPATEEAKKRLSALVKYNDGFLIAEEDLKIRGPGEFFGKRQHGLSELKIANPLTQMRLLKRAREEAVRIVHADPHLELRQNVTLRQELSRRFPFYERFVRDG